MRQFNLPKPPSKFDPTWGDRFARAVELALLQVSNPDPKTIIGAALVDSPILGGTPVFQTASGAESTGAASATLGANSPATVPGAPYKWLQLKTSDGTTVFLPVWK